MSIAIAVPFSPEPLDKLAQIVTRCCEFRPWFNDYDWARGEEHRRAMIIKQLASVESKTWEVYRDGELVGILHADEITPGIDARVHMIFFDRSLVDKRQLCRNMMGWLFEHYDLHALRCEIPTYASKLAGFARKALSLRYESERRPFSWPSSAAPLDANAAKLGSRRHQGILHEGRWHDILLLSITRAEFDNEFESDKDSLSLPQSSPA